MWIIERRFVIRRPYFYVFDESKAIVPLRHVYHGIVSPRGSIGIWIGLRNRFLSEG
jgi:hypothetical protein